RTIDTHVLSLRKKIETDPRQPSVIQTVRNIGYRFNPALIQGNKLSSGEAITHRNHNGHSTAQVAAVRKL
ncbi:MAG: helix-turn-helix domain-containing protein, partial [Cyanobacteriota bacterium]